MGIVENENRAMVWATSTHLVLLLMGLAGLSNAHIHWKNRAVTIPKKVGRTGTVSTDGQMGQRTVCYCATEKSSESPLFQTVIPGWDLWSIGMIRPGCSPRIGHDLDVRGSEDYSEERPWVA